MYTCHKPKAFICFIKLVYDCIKSKLNVSMYMPVAMPRVSLSCPIMESKYLFTRFKTLKDLHCKQHFQNLQICPISIINIRFVLLF